MYFSLNKKVITGRFQKAPISGVDKLEWLNSSYIPDFGKNKSLTVDNGVTITIVANGLV